MKNMNKNKVRGKVLYYKCQKCGVVYEEKEMAGKCENWCKRHKSCNLEIVRFAVSRK